MDGRSPKYGNHRSQAIPILLVTYPIPSSIPTYFNVIYPHVLFLKSEFMSHINIHVALSEKLPPQISINFNKFHGCYLWWHKFPKKSLKFMGPMGHVFEISNFFLGYQAVTIPKNQRHRLPGQRAQDGNATTEHCLGSILASTPGNYAIMPMKTTILKAWKTRWKSLETRLGKLFLGVI